MADWWRQHYKLFHRHERACSWKGRDWNEPVSCEHLWLVIIPTSLLPHRAADPDYGKGAVIRVTTWCWRGYSLKEGRPAARCMEWGTIPDSDTAGGGGSKYMNNRKCVRERESVYKQRNNIWLLTPIRGKTLLFMVWNDLRNFHRHLWFRLLFLRDESYFLPNVFMKLFPLHHTASLPGSRPSVAQELVPLVTSCLLKKLWHSICSQNSWHLT